MARAQINTDGQAHSLFTGAGRSATVTSEVNVDCAGAELEVGSDLHDHAP